MVECVEDYAIFMLDTQGAVLSWNRGAEKIKGYAAHEIIGQHFSAFYPSEDRASDRPGMALRVAEAEGRVEDEGWRLRKDGSRFWANVVITALRDERGSLCGFGKVTRDLTSRRLADEALRQSEERLRLLVESVPDYAIYMLGPNGEVTTWNSGAQNLKGYTAAEIIGRNYALFFTEEDVRAGKPVRELEIARSEGRFEEEGLRVRKSGARFLANVVLTPIRDAHGELRGFAKVTRDLSSRVAAEEITRALAREQAARAAAETTETILRKSEQRLMEAVKRAEEANRIKDEFLGTVSHELRTPLSAILGWSSILRSNQTDPVVSKAVEVIHRNAVAQSKIVDDILDVSRIIAGNLRLELKPVDLVAIANEAMEVVRPAAAVKQLELELAIEQTDALLVADPERLRQVIWNLLSNAVKFSEDGGQVVLRIEKIAGKIALSVSDTGRGIHPDFLPFVFDRFRQADGSSTRRTGGLGLGLSIVRHLVELHGGQVDAASNGLGQGATFRILLPVRAIAPAKDPSQSQAGPTMHTPAVLETARRLLHGKRVLVVDDEPDARELVQTVLEKAGAIVQVASSAAEGFAMLQTLRPHVLVSDVGMPGEDGYSLIQRVRAFDPGIPSLALTAYTRLDDMKTAMSKGFTNHASKPIKPEDLLRVVANLAALARY